MREQPGTKIKPEEIYTEYCSVQLEKPNLNMGNQKRSPLRLMKLAQFIHYL